MPKIISHARLTGQVGSVVFDNGVGHTDDEQMLAYFAEHADQYHVAGNEPGAVEPVGGWAALTDEQLLEAAEATGVQWEGDRDALVAALDALDADRDDFDADPSDEDDEQE